MAPFSTHGVGSLSGIRISRALRTIKYRAQGCATNVYTVRSGITMGRGSHTCTIVRVQTLVTTDLNGRLASGMAATNVRLDISRAGEA